MKSLRIAAGMLLVMFFSIGCSSYPTKLGVLPGGHITREHAKPMEGGYYQNFDPKAVSLEVAPMEDTDQVMTQHVLIATIKDAMGNPLPGRRVEWMITEGSVGTIVEVDESGWYNTRGYKINNKYAVSHTNHYDHIITRGNNDPSDDILLKKGQTWCVITSAVDGDTHLVVYAPSIFDWDKHKLFVAKHWTDAAWQWPPDATNPVGTPHDMEVKVMRASDGTPISDCVVNFKIISGPKAILTPDGKDTASIQTDASGIAKVRLTQVKPVEGQNVVTMEIVRKPCGECNPPMRIASGKMIKTWVGPRIGIKKTAPAEAGLGEQFNYKIIVTNPGQADASNVMVSDDLPAGIEYVSGEPEAKRTDQKLQWSLGTIKSQQSQQIAVRVKATQTGSFENCAVVNADHNLTGRSCAITRVTAPKLMLQKSGPDEVLICEPITYKLMIKNNGDGPAENINITDQLPEGLTIASGQKSVTAHIDSLDPGESKEFTYKANAVKSGTYENKSIATADRNLKAEASHKLVVRQPMLVITKNGPNTRFMNLNATYDITVTNKGDGPANKTVVADTLPEGMTFISATEGGKYANGKVTWDLGNLAPNATKTMSITVKMDRIGMLKNMVKAQALCTESTAEVTTQVQGIPAILLEVIDLEDPIEVGSNETYQITVTNQGSADDTNIHIVCTLPDEQEYISSDGPTKPVVKNKVVDFAPLPSLNPKAKAVYRLTVKCVKSANVRFKVEMTSTQLTTPVMETESTNIYD